jgi:hypothetical protein
VQPGYYVDHSSLNCVVSGAPSSCPVQTSQTSGTTHPTGWHDPVLTTWTTRSRAETHRQHGGSPRKEGVRATFDMSHVTCINNNSLQEDDPNEPQYVSTYTVITPSGCI